MADNDEILDREMRDISFADEVEEEQERRLIRHEYRRLLNETQENREEIIQSQPDCGLESCLMQAEALFPKVKKPREAVLDAKLVSECASLSKQKAEAFHTNFTVFRPVEFAEKLATFLGKSRVEDDDDVEFNRKTLSNHDVSIPKHRWVTFGKTISTVFHKTPSFHFMCGSFERGPMEYKKATRNSRRDEKDASSSVVVPQSVTGVGKSHQETTTEEVERLLGLLKKIHIKNNRQPVCYFKFVTNPHSFAQTVENMFHVSFLIKEGAAVLSLNEDHLPVIAPVGKRNEEKEDMQKMSPGYNANYNAKLEGNCQGIQHHQATNSTSK
ncbi:non-structural maintenance of chromosomes element 4 homolog A-like [Limulus polyphemus]|uniref:Non-structural maintenance of chromosomes element 4 n=1 Tax=Limulus polyphemus TaxID=6850 RepID=A0ABM1B3F9_LIMPO|nr:non-structural maintenance of chromosomes element 4 homolog A-like [Limulus polyphemus]